MSLRGYSRKKVAGDSGFVTQLTFFYSTIEISSMGVEALYYWTVCIQGSLFTDLPSFYSIVLLSLADLISTLIN